MQAQDGMHDTFQDVPPRRADLHLQQRECRLTMWFLPLPCELRST